MNLADLGRSVAAARRARRLSQTELGRAAGLSRQTISELERGVVPDLGVRKVARVLEVLELELLVRPEGHPAALDGLGRQPG
jgi:transcriptional regulator with XRE-family HTH domain